MKKRSDRRWQKSITVGRSETTGKLKRKVIYAKTKSELIAKTKEFEEQLATVDKAQPKTFSQFANEWLEVEKSDKSKNTRLLYSNVLRNHCNIIGNMSITEITKMDVQRQLNESAGHSATQESMLNVFVQVFDSAVENEICGKNPAASIKLPKKTVQKERNALTPFQCRCVENADLEPVERACLDLLYYTGMRRSELYALQKTDFDFDQEIIHVSRAVKYYGNETVIETPKTADGMRDLPMFQPLKITLETFLSTIQSELLFIGKRGINEPMTDYETTLLWKSIYSKLNQEAVRRMQAGDLPDIVNWLDPMQGITPHFFRHNFASMLYMAGVDVLSASKLLGHADIQTTLRIYTHLDKNKSMNDVSDKMSQYFGIAIKQKVVKN